MSSHKVCFLRAFTEDDCSGGNSAAVVPEAGCLTAAQMQAIAARAGVSETAFIVSSPGSGWSIRFYTPLKPIPHCGHATVAAFSLLLQQGRIFSESTQTLSSPSGSRAVQVTRDQRVFLEMPPAVYELPDPAWLENLAGALAGQAPSVEKYPRNVILADCANRFALIEVETFEAMKALRPNQAELTRLSEEKDLIGFYVFSRQASRASRAASARMFAPRFGIYEEAATGTAAGPLACWIAARESYSAPVQMIIEQGAAMNPPAASLLEVRLEGERGALQKVWVGGRAILISEQTIEVPT